jgi:hypothetical protein
VKAQHVGALAPDHRNTFQESSIVPFFAWRHGGQKTGDAILRQDAADHFQVLQAIIDQVLVNAVHVQVHKTGYNEGIAEVDRIVISETCFVNMRDDTILYSHHPGPHAFRCHDHPFEGMGFRAAGFDRFGCLLHQPVSLGCLIGFTGLLAAGGLGG